MEADLNDDFTGSFPVLYHVEQNIAKDLTVKFPVDTGPSWNVISLHYLKNWQSSDRVRMKHAKVLQDLI